MKETELIVAINIAIALVKLHDSHKNHLLSFILRSYLNYREYISPANNRERRKLNRSDNCRITRKYSTWRRQHERIMKFVYVFSSTRPFELARFSKHCATVNRGGYGAEWGVGREARVAIGRRSRARSVSWYAVSS